MDTASLTGKDLAAALNAETTARAQARTEQIGRAPRLALIVANDDPASAWYVNSLRKSAANRGIECDTVDLGADASADMLRTELSVRSADPATDAIMLQTPLPAGVSLDDVSPAIAATKDVDGVSPLSLGLLTAGSGRGGAGPPPGRGGFGGKNGAGRARAAPPQITPPPGARWRPGGWFACMRAPGPLSPPTPRR
ncbi:tetrahydrofolate dehydrogenase/cyclohydrolase catalytic domain-containing protein, partial [Nocardia flavorosea]|uniref:tetrahydrofolate dehydrogenase/cyclohydrolase catalytic domain-containing protein n=1 Tax=Nocardia flavorosea TaxID=53429 RepID=UPI002454250A